MMTDRKFLLLVGSYDQLRDELSVGDGKSSFLSCCLGLGMAASWFEQLWRSKTSPCSRGRVFCHVINTSQEDASRTQIRGGQGFTLRALVMVSMRIGRSISNIMSYGHVRSACKLKANSVVD